ncbi:hypothetical protein H2C43_10665 [Corynebacterium glutamicum]|uniref:hypothetical protein n=1 Tax=Corynebacterium glutamicum TaxID=1718 RepID=UPI0002F4EC35|nr:hypothetical protein [Corynebacterium glutamicum]ARV64793.1 hypothetical protein B7P23_07715 [Corynebacterium glutamicum]AUI00586.1 hypothetical protein CYL77_05295 [Corynebacterium glutamicum]AUI04231.1 hypothetical protein C0I99_08990 [Corynebacterium glutamicum]MBA4570444.1 hypothetical protein [Corynebacterium glutamicum]MBA4574026.1 hypothetical protein [Corynebacterium glutamicum]
MTIAFVEDIWISGIKHCLVMFIDEHVVVAVFPAVENRDFFVGVSRLRDDNDRLVICADKKLVMFEDSAVVLQLELRAAV